MADAAKLSLRGARQFATRSAGAGGPGPGPGSRSPRAGKKPVTAEPAALPRIKPGDRFTELKVVTDRVARRADQTAAERVASCGVRLLVRHDRHRRALLPAAGRPRQELRPPARRHRRGHDRRLRPQAPRRMVQRDHAGPRPDHRPGRRALVPARPRRSAAQVPARAAAARARSGVQARPGMSERTASRNKTVWAGLGEEERQRRVDALTAGRQRRVRESNPRGLAPNTLSRRAP